MAISNLIKPGQSFERPSVSAFFGKKPANDNLEKTSSMFTDSFLNSVTEALRSFNTEIVRIQESAKKIIVNFNSLVKAIKGLNKDITSKFRVLNNDLSTSKLEFVRNILTATVPAAGVAGAGGATKTVADIIDDKKQDAANPENKKEEEKKDEGGSRVVDALIAGLGLTVGRSLVVKALGGLIGILASPAAAAGLGLLAIGAAGYGAYTLAQLIGSEEFQNRLKESVAKYNADWEETKRRRAAEPTFNDRTASREQTLKNLIKPDGKPLSHKDFRVVPNDKGEEVLVFQPEIAKQFGFAGINVTTGEKYITVENSVPGQFKGTAIQGPPAPPATSTTATPTPPNHSEGEPTRATGTGGATSAPGGAANTGAPAGAPQKTESTAPSASGGGEAAGTGGSSGEVQGPPAPSTTAAGRMRSTVQGITAAPSAPSAPSDTPRMGAGANAPVVVNNNSVQNSSGSTGGESNNTAGTNLPLNARNPLLDEFLARQAISYQ